MNTCEDFLEVFILKGLRYQKTRQNTAKRGVSRSIHSKRLSKLALGETLKNKKGGRESAAFKGRKILQGEV